uniref:hypothetical protein n=1 Tax=Escherichia coli TaxID=562 RepID=UPI001BC8B3F5
LAERRSSPHRREGVGACANGEHGPLNTAQDDASGGLADTKNSVLQSQASLIADLPKGGDEVGEGGGAGLKRLARASAF